MAFGMSWFFFFPGQRRPKGDTSQDEKGLGGDLLTTMRYFMAAHRHKDPQHSILSLDPPTTTTTSQSVLAL